MVKQFNIGNYQQTIKIKDKKIADALCSCAYGSIHPEAWKDTKKLCWHLTTALNNLARKKK